MPLSAVPFRYLSILIAACRCTDVGEDIKQATARKALEISGRAPTDAQSTEPTRERKVACPAASRGKPSLRDKCWLGSAGSHGGFALSTPKRQAISWTDADGRSNKEPSSIPRTKCARPKCLRGKNLSSSD